MDSVLTVPHHKASAYVENCVFASFSTRQTRKDEKMSTKNPMYQAVINSYRTENPEN